MPAVPVLASVWLLIAPGSLFSREMTWDLLFNVAGAWFIENWYVSHRDFHTPIGGLGFYLTRLGFRVVGPTPQAFLVGNLLVLAMMFVTAVLAAARRLPPIPAVLFVVYVALMVLQPANVGASPNAYSFAMPYNRWGWSALCTLSLVLFMKPRQGHASTWADVGTAAVLILFLFYLKVTYALGSDGDPDRPCSGRACAKRLASLGHRARSTPPDRRGASQWARIGET